MPPTAESIIMYKYLTTRGLIKLQTTKFYLILAIPTYNMVLYTYRLILFDLTKQGSCLL